MKHLLFILFLLPVVLKAQIITTYAGSGSSVNSGDGGQATLAGINLPAYVTFDKNGNFYLTLAGNGNMVKKISPDGIISTIAGGGINTGDGGLAIDAALSTPFGITTDSLGNIFIAEAGRHRIRKIDVITGAITTIAGTGTAGYSGDGGLAINAELHSPYDVFMDKHGNLFIADAVNCCVRKVDTAGIIKTIAGIGTPGYNGDGGLADTTQLGFVSGVYADDTGNIYIAERNRLRKVDTFGIISTFAGTGISGIAGDGGPAISAEVQAEHVTQDKFGNFYICGASSNKVRRINSSGIIYTAAGTGVQGFSGDGGLADSAMLYGPAGMVTDSCGNLYFVDAQNYRVRKVAYNPSCTAMSVQGNHTISDIKISPNPAQNEITISGLSNASTISIINTLGQVLISENSAGPKTTMNISVLSADLYFIIIKDNQGKLQRMKFIKE